MWHGYGQVKSVRVETPSDRKRDFGVFHSARSIISGVLSHVPKISLQNAIPIV